MKWSFLVLVGSIVMVSNLGYAKDSQAINACYRQKIEKIFRKYNVQESNCGKDSYDISKSPVIACIELKSHSPELQNYVGSLSRLSPHDFNQDFYYLKGSYRDMAGMIADFAGPNAKQWDHFHDRAWKDYTAKNPNWERDMDSSMLGSFAVTEGEEAVEWAELKNFHDVDPLAQDMRKLLKEGCDSEKHDADATASSESRIPVTQGGSSVIAVSSEASAPVATLK